MSEIHSMGNIHLSAEDALIVDSVQNEVLACRKEQIRSAPQPLSDLPTCGMESETVPMHSVSTE